MKLLSNLRNLSALLTLAIAAIAAPFAAQAAAMTDYLESALINHVFRGTAYTAPSTIYVALFTSSCSDSAAGTEAAWTSYARVGVAANTSQWAAVSAGNGTTSNVNAVTFVTPGSGPTTVTHWGLYDAASAGNLMVCAALTASKVINSGDSVSFGAGALTFQIDN